MFKAAAAEADRLAIGVDSDQYFQVDEAEQDCMLSSMLKRVDVAVYEHHRATSSSGELEAGEPASSTWPTAASTTPPPVARSTTRPQIDDLKQQIIDGEIEVPTEPS